MPGTRREFSRDELRAEFVRILEIVVKDDISGITLDDDLPIQDQIAIESMDFLDFAIEVKKSLRIHLPLDTIAELSTIRNWIDFASGELITKGSEDPIDSESA